MQNYSICFFVQWNLELFRFHANITYNTSLGCFAII